MGNEANDVTSMRLCGLTDEQITARHRALRGSNALKYPPVHSQCVHTCGLGDDEGHSHRCFLVREHEGEHEFSSECALTRSSL